VQDLDAIPQIPCIPIVFSVNIDSVILDHRPGFDKFDLPQAKAVKSDWKNATLTLKVAVELETEDQITQALFPDRDLTQLDEVEQFLRNRFVQVFFEHNADIVVRRGSAGDRKLVIENNLTSEYPNVTTRFNSGDEIGCFSYILGAIAHLIIILHDIVAMIRSDNLSRWSYIN
jgi:hypothetical protein